MKIVNIGRAPHNDVIINDKFVSKTHVQITLDDKGNYFLKDLGSRNGTYVNGQRVNSIKLQENDIVRIGNEVLPWQNYFRDAKGEAEKKIKYAGFWLRFLAYFIDSIIFGIFSFIIGVIFSFITARNIEFGLIAYLPLYIITYIFQWLYFALMESSQSQATIGKMALSIKVTTLDGNRISFGQATGRFFGKIISFVILLFGFFMAGWTEKKQALHDIMASTLVVKKY